MRYKIITAITIALLAASIFVIGVLRERQQAIERREIEQLREFYIEAAKENPA